MLRESLEFANGGVGRAGGMLLVGPALFAFTLLLCEVATVLAVGRLHRLDPLPWAEKARRLYPARVARAGVAFLLMTASGPIAVIVGAMPHALPVWFLWCVAFASTLTASMVATVRLNRAARRETSTTWGEGAREVLADFLIRGQMLLVLAVVAALSYPGSSEVWLAAIILGVSLAQACGLSFALARAFGLARPAGSRLAAIVARTAARTGVEPRSVWEVSSISANAFAFPNAGWLAFTTRSLRALSDAEIDAVCCHEMGHLTEGRATVALRIALAMLLPSLPVLCFALSAPWNAAAAGVFVASLVLYGRTSRTLERRADRAAHGWAIDVAAFASSLERIYEANLVPAVLGRRNSTHPELYDRLLAAGVTPAYTRPDPPARLRGLLAICAASVLGFALLGAAERAFVRSAAPQRAHALRARAVAAAQCEAPRAAAP